MDSHLFWNTTERRLAADVEEEQQTICMSAGVSAAQQAWNHNPPSSHVSGIIRMIWGQYGERERGRGDCVCSDDYPLSFQETNNADCRARVGALGFHFTLGCIVWIPGDTSDQWDLQSSPLWWQHQKQDDVSFTSHIYTLETHTQESTWEKRQKGVCGVSF